MTESQITTMINRGVGIDVSDCAARSQRVFAISVTVSSACSFKPLFIVLRRQLAWIELNNAWPSDTAGPP